MDVFVDTVICSAKIQTHDQKELTGCYPWVLLRKTWLEYVRNDLKAKDLEGWLAQNRNVALSTERQMST